MVHTFKKYKIYKILMYSILSLEIRISFAPSWGPNEKKVMEESSTKFKKKTHIYAIQNKVVSQDEGSNYHMK